MHPAYFAMVMATGIVSIACHLLGMPVVALALFWLNIVFYVVALGADARAPAPDTAARASPT